MSLNVEISGLDGVDRRLEKLGADVAADRARAIAKTAHKMKSFVQRGIVKGPATGRVYKRRSVTHQASAAGEAPMSDTGRLAQSVTADVERASATVGSNVVYAAHLEYGTRNMEPRPIWEPAAVKGRKWLKDAMQEAVERAVK